MFIDEYRRQAARMIPIAADDAARAIVLADAAGAQCLCGDYLVTADGRLTDVANDESLSLGLCDGCAADVMIENDHEDGNCGLGCVWCEAELPAAGSLVTMKWTGTDYVTVGVMAGHEATDEHTVATLEHVYRFRLAEIGETTLNYSDYAVVDGPHVRYEVDAAVLFDVASHDVEEGTDLAVAYFDQIRDLVDKLDAQQAEIARQARDADAALNSVTEALRRIYSGHAEATRWVEAVNRFLTSRLRTAAERPATPQVDITDGGSQ